jgi:hypothetical protein
MCLACQMDQDEMWFAYLDQLALQQKAAAQVPGAAEPDKAASAAAAPASPFACEELPPE